MVLGKNGLHSLIFFESVEKIYNQQIQINERSESYFQSKLKPKFEAFAPVLTETEINLDLFKLILKPCFFELNYNKHNFY